MPRRAEGVRRSEPCRERRAPRHPGQGEQSITSLRASPALVPGDQARGDRRACSRRLEARSPWTGTVIEMLFNLGSTYALGPRRIPRGRELLGGFGAQGSAGERALPGFRGSVRDSASAAAEVVAVGRRSNVRCPRLEAEPTDRKPLVDISGQRLEVEVEACSRGLASPWSRLRSAALPSSRSTKLAMRRVRVDRDVAAVAPLRGTGPRRSPITLKHPAILAPKHSLARRSSCPRPRPTSSPCSPAACRLCRVSSEEAAHALERGAVRVVSASVEASCTRSMVLVDDREREVLLVLEVVIVRTLRVSVASSRAWSCRGRL